MIYQRIASKNSLKTTFIVLVLFLALITIASTIQKIDAQGTQSEFLQIVGKNIQYKGQNIVLRGANFANISALKGINIGGIGSGKIQDIEVREEDYKAAREVWGMNHVRFGMSYSWWTNDTTTNKTNFFSVIDQHVAWAKKYGMWITLLQFTLPGDCYEGYNEDCFAFWDSPAKRNELKDFWVKMAQHYVNEPIVSFDLINEPVGSPSTGWAGAWTDTLAQEYINAVRAVNTNVPLFITAGSDATFPRTYTGGNIIYEVHFYEPMEITHNYSNNSSTYPGTYCNQWKAGCITWNRDMMVNYLKQWISVDWATSKNVPIYYGEWGSLSSSGVNYTAYLGDLANAIATLNINHAYYSYKAGNSWGMYNSGWPLVERSTSKNAAIKPAFANNIFFNGSTTTNPPAPVCGNGSLEIGEVCDDGNTSNGDQCSSTCQNSCVSPQTWNGSSCVTNTTAPVCGNNIKETGETCDDGNLKDFDSCSSTCQNICNSPQIWNTLTCLNPNLLNSVSSTNFQIEAENYDSGSGSSGKGINFDGSNDVVSINDNNLLDPQNITFEFWVKFNQLASSVGRSLILFEHDHSASPWRSYDAYLQTSNKFAIDLVNNSGSSKFLQSSTTVQLNTWYHIAVTQDGSNINLYVNGSSEASTSWQGGSLFNADGALSIGAESRYGGWSPVIMDEVRLWNTSRTQTQIQQDMNKEIASNSSGLIGYWKLNEGSGTTALDSTSNALNGTLINGPTYVDAKIGSNNSYYDTTSGNSGQIYRGDDVDINSSGSKLFVTDFAQGEWLKYSVNVATEGTYALKVNYASASASASAAIRIEVDDVLWKDITLSSTGNLSTFQLATIDGGTLTSGSKVFKITSTTPGINLDYIRFELPNSLPIACKADYNLNGTIDISDFGVFGQNYKSQGMACNLDVASNDCYLSIEDFLELSKEYKKVDACKITN